MSIESQWVVAGAVSIGVAFAACGGSGPPAGEASAAASPSVAVAADAAAQRSPAAELSAEPNDPLAALRAAGEAAAAYSERFGGRALLVLRRGEVVFERYSDGWSESRRHPLASGTKSFVGVIAAAAVEDGLIEWDAPVSRWIVEWAPQRPQDGGDGASPAAASPRERITIRQLLDLSSGLDPSEATLGSAGGGPLSRELGDDRLERGRAMRREEQPRDKFAASVSVELVSPPGERFAYGPSHFMLFGEVMNRALRADHKEGSGAPRSVEAYLDSRILRPIGLGGVTRGWGRDRAGNLALPGGAMLTAREWAKFGELVRRGGRATGPDGEEIAIVDEAILRRCFEPSAANPAYGLTWWLPSRGAEAAEVADGVRPPQREAAGGSLRDRLRERLRDAQSHRTLEIVDPASGEARPLEVWMAAGLGKQRLLVIPELELVVVRFGRNIQGLQRFDDRELLGGIAAAAAELLAAERAAAAP
jgi:CubicO group peptidase (beta-lactamase class C family)